MQKNILNVFVISIMSLWSTTTAIMDALQTRLLLLMLPRRVKPLATVLPMNIFKMGRQNRQSMMFKIWQEQCDYMPKQDGHMSFTYPFGHMQ